MNSELTRRRFAAALDDCRAAGVACQLGAMQEVFGSLPGSGWQFYTSGEKESPFALGIRGTASLLAGPADGEELAGFLGFLGVHQLRTTGAVPDGWKPREKFSCMTLASDQQLVEQPLPAGVRLTEQPSVGRVADFLCQGESLGGQADAWDCFYSETCTLVNHGCAQIWAAENETGRIVATAGAYAIWNNTAYLAGVETCRTERGKGLGRFLVAGLANRLAGQGLFVELLCRPERQGFYQRLGFIKQGEVSSYSP